MWRYLIISEQALPGHKTAELLCISGVNAPKRKQLGLLKN